MTKTKVLQAYRRATVVLTLLWLATAGALVFAFYYYDGIESLAIRRTACRLKAPELKTTQEKCEMFVECTQDGKSLKSCLHHLL